MATWLHSLAHQSPHAMSQAGDHFPLTNHDALNDVIADVGDQEVLTRAKRYIVSQGFMEQSRVVALYIIFIIIILLINAFMIVAVLVSKAMRSSSRHVLIISVCLGDLIMGLFVLPVLLNLGLRDDDDSTLDCTSFNALRLFADFLLPSATTLAVLMLNVDYLLRISVSAYGEGLMRAAMMAGLFLTPWVVSGCVVIPLYLDALHATDGPRGISATSCAEVLDLKLWGKMTRALLIAFVLLVLNIVVTSVYLCKRDTFHLDVCGERIRAPVDICLASFSTLVLYTPVFLISLLTTQGYLACSTEEQCDSLRDTYVLAIWAFFAKSWVLHFSWLACRDTRQCIRKLFG